MKKIIAVIFLVIASYATASIPNKPIKIYFWHSMSAQPGMALQVIIDGFNQSQQKYKVIGVYKGNYNEALTALVAAFRAKQQPATAQVFEIGTATMMASAGAIVPVYQLMQNNGYPLNPKIFLPAIAAYYSDSDGQLMSMPFNASAPVLYYNKQAFIKAGLDPNQPPSTWPLLAADGEKLLKAGYSCAYTTTWPAWIQLESFSAWHNIPYATADNGFKSYQVQVLYNNPLILRQLTALANWQKTGIFEYGGQEDDAQSLFTSGHCVMLTQSSGSRTELQNETNFPIGVAELPYWPDVKGAPQNAIIGGASLWVMSGHSAEVYQGVAEFFYYLLQTNVQTMWQAQTGYLPLTQAAYQASKAAGFYQRFPGAEIAIKEVTNKSPTNNSRGIRLGYFSQIRDINNMAMEAVFSGAMNPQQALNYAVAQANRLLIQFAAITQVGQQ